MRYPDPTVLADTPSDLPAARPPRPPKAARQCHLQGGESPRFTRGSKLASWSMPHDYRTMRALEPAPQSQRLISIGSLLPERARTGLLHHGLDDPDPCEAIDCLLLQACHTQADPDAFLCLRCRVSHCIEQKLLALVRQFGRFHGLDLIELATTVLDD